MTQKESRAGGARPSRRGQTRATARPPGDEAGPSREGSALEAREAEERRGLASHHHDAAFHRESAERSDEDLSTELPAFEPDDPTARAAMRFWSGARDDDPSTVDSRGGRLASLGVAGGRRPEEPTGLGSIHESRADPVAPGREAED